MTMGHYDSCYEYDRTHGHTALRHAETGYCPVCNSSECRAGHHRYSRPQQEKPAVFDKQDAQELWKDHTQMDTPRNALLPTPTGLQYTALCLKALSFHDMMELAQAIKANLGECAFHVSRIAEALANAAKA